LYKKSEIRSLGAKSQILSLQTNSVGAKLHKLILANNAINKTLFILNYIKLEKNPTVKLYLTAMKETINNLAYYYGINAPITIHVSYPTKMPDHTLTKIAMNISFHANSDENVIRLVDSLAMNLKGFLKIQKMEIFKNKEEDLSSNKKQINNNIITCNLALDWYIVPSHKAHNRITQNEVIKIYPQKPKVEVEDVYRVSVWENSLMLPPEYR